MFHVLLQSADHYLVIYRFFKFAIAISISRGLGPGASGLGVCISVCLVSLIRHFQ
jgi:hypothetical protein